ncbi:MAG: hypothetical protein MAG794_01453 [Gammaproteobacteria bacterium]|nr:hypothetical protein [Gammaproteobacteria bacterium]
MLDELLREPLEISLSASGTCLERVQQIRESYRSLNRSELDAEQLLELKFANLHWRRKLLARLHEDPPAWLASDHNTLTGIVDALDTRLPDALISRLSRYVDPRTIHYLLARQGTPSDRYPEYRALAGPGVLLNIRANRSSPWPFGRWSRNPVFGVYEFAGDGVNFRGLHFRPGDVLLANVNIDGNGVYTTLSDPTRFSSHSAIFAILKDGNERYPAVIETYEKGARAVPLNVFLDTAFSAYVEVYRHRDLNETHSRTINRSALDMLDRVQGYNFDSKEDDRDYVSCCTVARLLHMDAGLEPASWKSRIQHPGIQANLQKLDYVFFDFFAPVDYLLDRNFGCAGWVDNHQFEDLLARELVEGYFRELFITRTLNPKRFPFVSRVNRWGIRHIRRQSVIGRAIGKIEGFDHRSLPKGPDALLAVITIAEAQLGRAIKQTRRWLKTLDYAADYFSLEEFSRKPEVREHLETTVELPWLEENRRR